MKLTPQIVSYASLLRAIQTGGHDSAAALAEAGGRIANNLNRDLRALEKEELITYAPGAPAWLPRLTPSAAQGLAALDRAEGPIADPEGSAEPDAPPGLVNLLHHQIEPDPNNARQHIDSFDLNKLRATIEEHGLLQNLVVRPAGPNGKHRLIAGERRWRAIEIAIHTAKTWPADKPLPCRIVELESEADFEVAALIENLSREELHPLDEATALGRLVNDHGLSTAQAAEKVGRSQRHVQDRLRFIDLRPDLKARMRLDPDNPGHLTPTAVRKLIAEVKPKAEERVSAEASAPAAHTPLSPHFNPTPAAPAPTSPQPAKPAPRSFSTGGQIADPRKQMEAAQAERDALAAIELSGWERLALLELAHAIGWARHKDVTALETPSHEDWICGVFPMLARHGLARVLSNPGRRSAVLTLRGEKKLRMERGDKAEAPVSDLELHAARSAVGHADWPADGGYVSHFLQRPAPVSTDAAAEPGDSPPTGPDAWPPAITRQRMRIEAERLFEKRMSGVGMSAFATLLNHIGLHWPLSPSENGTTIRDALGRTILTVDPEEHWDDELTGILATAICASINGSAHTPASSDHFGLLATRTFSMPAGKKDHGPPAVIRLAPSPRGGWAYTWGLSLKSWGVHHPLLSDGKTAPDEQAALDAAIAGITQEVASQEDRQRVLDWLPTLSLAASDSEAA